jgi:hypothetical protein
MVLRGQQLQAQTKIKENSAHANGEKFYDEAKRDSQGHLGHEIQNFGSSVVVHNSCMHSYLHSDKTGLMVWSAHIQHQAHPLYVRTRILAERNDYWKTREGGGGS